MASTFFSAFNGSTYKLGGDQSVTQWTAIDNLAPSDLTEFDGNVWFNGNTAAQGSQLYKLGFDGSVTKWTAINPGGGGLRPFDLTDFNDAWFTGLAPNQGAQLYKLGNDGSVTQWTAVPGGFNPQLVSQTNDPDSTPSSRMQRGCKPIITRTAAPSYTNWEPMAA